MAGSPSNFDAEIKKGMQPKGAKTSTNAAPMDKTPAKGGKFNAQPKASPAQPNDVSGDTHTTLMNAAQAHSDAMAAHIKATMGQ